MRKTTEKVHDETYFAMLAYAMNNSPSVFYDRFKSGDHRADLFTTNALTGAVLSHPVVVLWKPSYGPVSFYSPPQVHDARVWCTEETQKTDIVAGDDAHIRALAIKVMRKLVNK
jgi:hypothetical protein